MKFVLLIALGIALQTSLVIHVVSLIGYLMTKKMNHFKNFMITAVSNVSLSICIAAFVAIDQSVIQGFRIEGIFILESGMLFFYMLAVKVRVTIGVIRRARDPSNYHFSHFGKKIYHTSIIDYKELITYFITFPFTLMAGAYFVVKCLQY